ncbi:MAG: glycosyl transferase [Microbacterium sp.]|nr:glycosyl transferase [Microbacterium sp.]
MNTLSSVVFPEEDDKDIHPLYFAIDDGAAQVSGRHTLTLTAGSRVSLGTYFNAFPAAYWRKWCGIDKVQVSVEVQGQGDVEVWRSSADGRCERVSRLSSGKLRTVVVPLGDIEDGGWLWLEAYARSAMHIAHARWGVEEAPVRRPAATLGITTFNKPEYCVATLTAIAADPGARSVLRQIIVVDQGTNLVTEHADFGKAAGDLGGTLAVVRQPNVGGSGGYARAMLAAQADTASEFVLLMDDDVEVEPESIRRAVMFGAYCTVPTIVGGHMLDLLNRSRLYAWAEVVDERPFMWRPVDQDRMPVDLAQQDLREEPSFHRRIDADYNGWWMCLVPTSALGDLGLALPAFIKWDDAEYSLRAAQRGVATVSLPGVALWHVAWTGKDDQVDWQAYFHARNRILTALLHSTARRGGSLLKHSRRVDLKHVMAMQYYPVALRHAALRAILSGPDHLHPDLREALPAARALAAEYPETKGHTAAIHAPRPTNLPTDESDRPAGVGLVVFMIRAITLQWLHRPRDREENAAEVRLSAGQARWWRLWRYDSAVVESAATGEPHLFVRNRNLARRLLRDSIRLHRELRRRWPELARRYRDADLVSPERWRDTLGA